MAEDMRLVHLRIPKRLIDALDHYAIDRNLYRAEALAEILEEKFSGGELNRVPVAVNGQPAIMLTDLTADDFHSKYGTEFSSADQFRIILEEKTT